MEPVWQILIFLNLLSLALEDAKHKRVSNYKLLVNFILCLGLRAGQVKSWLSLLRALKLPLIIIAIFIGTSFYEYQRGKKLLGAGDFLLLGGLVLCWQGLELLTYLTLVSLLAGLGAISLSCFNFSWRHKKIEGTKEMPLVPFFLLGLLLLRCLRLFTFAGINTSFFVPEATIVSYVGFVLG